MKTAVQTPADFDTAFSQLLRAFNAHEDLRARKATTRELARSSQTLFNARMDMRRACR